MTSSLALSPAVPPGLALAEKVLSLMKQAANGTDVWERSAVNTDEMLQAGTRLCDLELAELQGDSLPEDTCSAFLHKHWQAARGVPSDSTFFFVARRAEPSYLKLRTFSRLGYIEMLPRFARALDGLPVSLNEDRSWTWDESVRTLAGRPTYFRAFVLNVMLKEAFPFKAERWLKSAALDMCPSLDPRADACVLQMRENARLPGEYVTAYRPTKTGWILDCADAAAAEKVSTALFSGCTVEVKPGKHRGEKQVQLVVQLP